MKKAPVSCERAPRAQTSSCLARIRAGSSDTGPLPSVQPAPVTGPHRAATQRSTAAGRPARTGHCSAAAPLKRTPHPTPLPPHTPSLLASSPPRKPPSPLLSSPPRQHAASARHLQVRVHPHAALQVQLRRVRRREHGRRAHLPPATPSRPPYPHRPGPHRPDQRRPTGAAAGACAAVSSEAVSTPHPSHLRGPPPASHPCSEAGGGRGVMGRIASQAALALSLSRCVSPRLRPTRVSLESPPSPYALERESPPSPYALERESPPSPYALERESPPSPRVARDAGEASREAGSLRARAPLPHLAQAVGHLGEARPPHRLVPAVPHLPSGPERRV